MFRVFLGCGQALWDDQQIVLPIVKLGAASGGPRKVSAQQHLAPNPLVFVAADLSTSSWEARTA
jgi:hypothetical protein